MCRNACWLLSYFVLAGACDSRAVVAADGGSDARAETDGPHTDERRADGTVDALAGQCQRLTLAGQATLGQLPDHVAHNAALTHDGQGFAVTWVSDADLPSANSGELLFSRLDYAGRVLTPDAVVLAETANRFPEPRIVYDRGEYAVLHETPSGAFISRVDGRGTVLAKHALGAPVDSFALSASPSGLAVLYAPETPGVSTLVFAKLGAAGLAEEHTVHSGGFYGYPWLASTPAGFTAAWGDRLVLLDERGAPRGSPVQTVAKEGAFEPSFAVAPGGYGAVYARSDDFFIEGQPLDAAGNPQGEPRPIAQANIGAAPLRQLFLDWTGSSYVLAYPAESGGKPHVQLLDSRMAPVGERIALPGCLSWHSGPISAAFGGGRLAVAYVGMLSGPVGSIICVAVLECGQ